MVTSILIRCYVTETLVIQYTDLPNSKERNTLAKVAYIHLQLIIYQNRLVKWFDPLHRIFAHSILCACLHVFTIHNANSFYFRSHCH